MPPYLLAGMPPRGIADTAVSAPVDTVGILEPGILVTLAIPVGAGTRLHPDTLVIHLHRDTVVIRVDRDTLVLALLAIQATPAALVIPAALDTPAPPPTSA
jgi:hypothetical protein